MRGPGAPHGTSRNAASSESIGAVISVGRYAVTPASSSASPARVAGDVGRGEVHPAEAVHLQVDEARRRRFRGRCRSRSRSERSGRRRSRRRPARAAGRRARLRRRASSRLDRVAHVVVRARAARALAPRPRAARRSRLAFPSAASSASSARSGGAPVASRTIAGRVAQLVVRRRDVDHQVPEGLAEADHRDGRDRVEHELLRAVPAFSRVEPAISRADDDGDLALGELASAAFPTAVTATVCAPAARAARSAPITYGVRPLALIPTTTSRSPGASAIRSSSPARRRPRPPPARRRSRRLPRRSRRRSRRASRTSSRTRRRRPRAGRTSLRRRR